MRPGEIYQNDLPLNSLNQNNMARTSITPIPAKRECTGRRLFQKSFESVYPKNATLYTQPTEDIYTYSCKCGCGGGQIMSIDLTK